jgi:hypothetical protein
MTVSLIKQLTAAGKVYEDKDEYKVILLLAPKPPKGA